MGIPCQMNNPRNITSEIKLFIKCERFRMNFYMEPFTNFKHIFRTPYAQIRLEGINCFGRFDVIIEVLR